MPIMPPIAPLINNLVTPVYAALLALVFIALSVRTILVRRRALVAVGHNDNPELLRATRVHANFAEYVPLALLLIYFTEVGGAPLLWVHALGVLLLLGRVLHAFGMSQAKEDLKFRVSGMLMTLGTLGLAALYLLAMQLR